MSVLYIIEQGAYLRSSGGRYVVTKRDAQLASIPKAAVDSVVVYGSAQVSSTAVSELLRDGVPLIYLSRSGSFRGILEPRNSKNVFLRMAQYDGSLNHAFALSVAKEVVRAKVASQKRIASRWERAGWMEKPDDAREWGVVESSLDGVGSVSELLGVEARAAALHFKRLGAALPPLYPWRGRSRQPPRDAVNALLSLSYMSLLGEMVSECHACGLDPFVGMLHQLDYGRPSLALDLIEPLRARCDHFALSLLHTEQLRREHFTDSAEHGTRLTSEGIKLYFMERERSKRSRKGNQTSLEQLTRRMARGMAEAVRLRVAPAWSGELDE